MKDLIKQNFATQVGIYKSLLSMLGRFMLLSLPKKEKCPKGPDQRKWWEKAGIGVMYQIEKRPDVAWDRDYLEFNKSMMDEKGNLKFNGPFCKIEDWVALSKKIGLDYHIFEIKWHDGICWFKTELTRWKTEVDYAGKFADLSRKEKIPFMYYYSAIFDHNPQFDSIQPNARITPSFLGLLPDSDYEKYAGYLRRQYDEIVQQYKPDGIWIDWWWGDKTTKDTVTHFKGKYPGVVLAFNFSSMIFSSHKHQHYTSGEAHSLDGPLSTAREEPGGKVTIFVSAWKWANMNRMLFKHPWELITPVSLFWQDMELRADIYDFVRQAAVVMACGGKFLPGTSAQMDGSLYPDHIKQLTILGEWYVPRKQLFLDAHPIRYNGYSAKGVSIDKKDFNTVASFYMDGVLLHIINMKGKSEPVELTLKGKTWEGVQSAYLEPEHRQIEVQSRGSNKIIIISKDDIDHVDTIVHLPDINSL